MKDISLTTKLEKTATLLTLIRLSLRLSHLPQRGRQGALRAQVFDDPTCYRPTSGPFGATFSQEKALSFFPANSC